MLWKKIDKKNERKWKYNISFIWLLMKNLRKNNKENNKENIYVYYKNSKPHIFIAWKLVFSLKDLIERMNSNKIFELKLRA